MKKTRHKPIHAIKTFEYGTVHLNFNVKFLGESQYKRTHLHIFQQLYLRVIFAPG